MRIKAFIMIPVLVLMVTAMGSTTAFGQFVEITSAVQRVNGDIDFLYNNGDTLRADFYATLDHTDPYIHYNTIDYRMVITCYDAAGNVEKTDTSAIWSVPGDATREKTMGLSFNVPIVAPSTHYVVTAVIQKMEGGTWKYVTADWRMFNLELGGPGGGGGF